MNDQLFQSLNMSIVTMAEAPNPVLRSLAVLDARFGKRRLGTFDLENKHELVQKLYDFRRELN